MDQNVITKVLSEAVIKSVIVAERHYRDTAQWSKLRNSYHPDASKTRINISWYDGPIDGFVAGSQSMAAKGVVATHNITPSSIQIGTAHALAESVGCIVVRFLHNGHNYDLTSWCRFISRMECVDRLLDWKMLSLDVIYVRDSIVPATPSNALDADFHSGLEHWTRNSYKHLAWHVAQQGVQVRDDLPGIDDEDTVRRVMISNQEWFDQIENNQTQVHQGRVGPSRIDVHSHFVPPKWREAVQRSGKGPIPPQWSEEVHLLVMEAVGISKSILSLSTPGVNLRPDGHVAVQQLCRDCNIFAADLKQRHPDKFGFWASLPFPDLEGSIAEIEYALDTLNADGVALLTNYDGIYLGDRRFDTIFAELNRRQATVFIHPTNPCVICKDEAISAAPLPQFSDAMFEFLFEEARVFFNLFLSETVERFPDIKYIIPHAGGVIAPLIERFMSFSTFILGKQEDNKSLTRASVKCIIERQFYFDLAGFVIPDQLPGLLGLASPSRLLYGSDYPYTPEKATIRLVQQLDEALEGFIFEERSRTAIFTTNAERLLHKDKI